MNKAVKIIVEVILFVAIVGLVYVIYGSIMQPVNFNKEKAQREAVAIQRLKDIRTLQVAFKSVNGRFTPSVDSLKDFYQTGNMSVIMQVGSADDSLAMAHTDKVKDSQGQECQRSALSALSCRRQESRVLCRDQDSCKGHPLPLTHRLLSRFSCIHSVLRW